MQPQAGILQAARHGAGLFAWTALIAALLPNIRPNIRPDRASLARIAKTRNDVHSEESHRQARWLDPSRRGRKIRREGQKRTAVFSGWDFDLLHSFVREQTHRPLLASHKPLPAKTASYPQAGAQNYAINQMAQSGARALVPNRATGSAQEQGLALPVAPHWLLRPQEPSGGLIAGNWAAVASRRSARRMRAGPGGR